MSHDHADCPRCGGGGTTNSPRWHWLHRIRQKPYTPLNWFGDKRESPRNEKPQSPAYPTLPTPRPRALTLDSSPYPPNPSETSTPILHTASQSSSLFFSRLPFELRMLVYRELFGNRTVHIQLYHGYPGLPGIRHNMDEDKSKPEGWYWWHSVCHRDPEIAPIWRDNCRGGTGLYCSRGSDRGGCHIDTRWLFTCRQG
jgi:hypothetical protein